MQIYTRTFHISTVAGPDQWGFAIVIPASLRKGSRGRAHAGVDVQAALLPQERRHSIIGICFNGPNQIVILFDLAFILLALLCRDAIQEMLVSHYGFILFLCLSMHQFVK